MSDLFDEEYLTDGKRDTSRAAGESVRDHVSRLEGIVRDAIAHNGGLTCAEVEVKCNLSHQTASARITGLQIKNMLVDSGLRRATPTGRKAIVWRVLTR